MSYYRSPLGINLDGNTYYSYSYPFLNLLKRSGTFLSYQNFASGPSWLYVTDDRGCELDPSGYVSSLLGPVSSEGVEIYGRQRALTILDDRPIYGAGTDGPYLGCKPPNPFVLTYEGSGTVYILNSLLLSGSGNRQVYNLSSGNNSLVIDAIDPNNYPRNISVVPLEYEGQDTLENPFHPRFLGTLSGGPGEISPRFKCFRAMTWQNSNSAGSGDYYNPDIANNPPEELVGYGGGVTQYPIAMPYKVMCRLCNLVRCDLWMAIPAASSAEEDVYISSVAAFIRDNLDSELKVYIEYSNETWNGIFAANAYTLMKGIEMFGPGGDIYSKRVQYHCWITDKISRIFKEVFAVSGQQSRVKGVLGVQSAGEWHVSAVAIPYLITSGLSSIDCVAGAPYFGDVFANQFQASALMLETSTPAQIAEKVYEQVISGISLSAIREVVGPEPGYSYSIGDLVIQSANQNMRYADHSRIRGLARYCAASGFQYIAYEGGPHLTPNYPHYDVTYITETISNLFASANREPYMGSAVYEYLKGWNEETSGALFCYFTDLSPYSRYGYWGADESFFFWGQSEKAQALDLYISEYSVFEGPLEETRYIYLMPSHIRFLG